jgi:SAM-dependent methyltransferase
MVKRDLIRRLWMPLRRLRGRVEMSLGRVRSATPLSNNFGYERGTPIDRYYIEGFLKAHSSDIRGRVLEIGDDCYSRRFGGSRIVSQDVLHIRAAPGATIVGDISQPGVLPVQAFDCIVLTQTLHLIFDMTTAVGQLYQSLRPGGVLLVTVPGISPIDRGEWGESWCWSLSETALKRLLATQFEPGDISVRAYGNLFAATAFLHGAAVEEVRRSRLDPVDPAFPVTVAARAKAS